MGWWETFKEWFLSLGEKYHVNPFIFGGIYLGAIQFFFISLYRTIKNIKKKKSILPVLLTGFFFISANLYLIIVGKNIPLWGYIFIGLMVVYGNLFYY